MRITKVSIDGFGMFDGPFEIEFPGEIALIVGDNETGKSTILSALGAILFGLENENEKAVFAPHGAASPRSGSLEIEAGGKRHRLGRNFATNHARVELLDESESVLFDGSAKPRGRTDEKDDYDELMRKLLGTESRDVFQNSVMAEQNSLKPEMEDVVRRIVSGSSSADYAVVLENLKKVCEELSMDLPWRPGTARKLRRMEQLEAELNEKRLALAAIREGETIIEQSRDRLASTESQLTEVTDSLSERKSWEETLVSFSLATEEKKRLEQQLNERRKDLRDIDKLRGELEACMRRIDAEFSRYASLPEQAEADMAGLIQLRENEKELEERYGQTEMDVLPILRVLRLRFSAIAVSAGLLIAGIGAARLEGIPRVIAIFAGIGISAWPFVSAMLALREHESARRGKLEEIKRQIESLMAQSSEIENRYPELAEMHPADVLKKLRESEELRREKELKEEALKQHPSLKEAESKFNSLSNELVFVNDKLGNLKLQRPSLSDVKVEGRIGEAIEEARAEISRLERRHMELMEQRQRLGAKLAAAEAKETGSEETLEEEISERESELGRLKLNRDAHLLAVKTLGESISEFRSAHLARIARKTTEYLRQITGSQCRVSLGERLEPLGVEQAGQLLSPEQLSQGFRDQMHFALRLAAAEEISGDVRLPILLDDPFVNFDEKRLEATLRMLEKLSESHQVVLFAHDRRYINWREPARLL